MEMLIIALVAIAAFAAVLIPLFRRRPGVGDEREFENVPPADIVEPRSAAAPDQNSTPAGAQPTDDTLEGEVLRYREAVRAGTVCPRCGQANRAGSLFCSECGTRLPLADAKEFE